MAESVDTTELLTAYKEVFKKQSESLNQVMIMLTSKNNSSCGLNNQEYDEGRLLEVTTCHCVPTPPAGTGLQVSSIVYDCRDTNGSYAVNCSQGDCSTDLWPRCGDDSEKNNEDDDTMENNEYDPWQYVECEAISVPYLNTSVSCGAGWKSRGVKRLIGQGVFSQEEQLPCQECDQQLFQWSTWSTVGDKMVRHRGSNRIKDSYQKEERTVPQVILIGPGYGSDGKSEVLSLPDLTPLDCNIPVFPDRQYRGYVGGYTSDGVLMCGGMTSSGYTSSCYLLTSSGYQDMPGLINKRYQAASVVTPSGLWVTGGRVAGFHNLDTTELVTNNQSRPHVRLPRSVAAHCLVSINQTHYLLIGGEVGFSASRSAYLYSEDGGFSKIEDLKTTRYNHRCSVINNNTVIVAGDYVSDDSEYYDDYDYDNDYDAGTSSDSELLNLTTMTWSTGPELPEDVFLARMVGNILIGKKKIYKLEEIMEQRKQWRWIEMLEITNSRMFAQAFVVDQNLFCKN